MTLRLGWISFLVGTIGCSGAVSDVEPDRSPEPATGQLRILLTDAPTPEVDEVWVDIREVTAHHETFGWVSVTSTGGLHDLLSLQSGVTALLGAASVPSGTYDQIRFEVLDAWVSVDGADQDLDIPSGSTSGIKVHTTFCVGQSGGEDILVDWDVQDSLKSNPSRGFWMNPSVHVVYAPQCDVAVDADGDGFDDTQDCDDNDPAVFPGAIEICDRKDQDCDGLVDEGFEPVDVVYVDAAATGAGDGTSWADAFNHPQDGVNAAVAGQKVYVAAGVYGPVGSAVIQTSKDIEMYGGFDVAAIDTCAREVGGWPTVLDAGGGQAFKGWVTRLDGFEITNGNAVFDGVVSIDGTGMELANLDVHDNITSPFSPVVSNGMPFGGGSSTVMLIEDSRFADNLGPVINFAFSDTVVVRRSSFERNIADWSHAITMGRPGSLVVEDSSFLENRPSFTATGPSDGGAIECTIADLTVTNTAFVGNSNAVHAHNGPGATLENLLVAGSTTSSAVFVWTPGNPGFAQPVTDLRNSTFVDNAGFRDLEIGPSSTIANSLVPAFTTGGAGIFPNHSLIGIDPQFVSHGVWDDQGTLDPLDDTFVGWDYRLAPGPPAIDAGDGDQAPLFDLDGAARADDPATPDTGSGTPTFTDIGAYEYQP